MRKVAIAIERILLYINIFAPFSFALVCSVILSFFSWESIGFEGKTFEYFDIPELNHRICGIFLTIVLFVLIYVLEHKLDNKNEHINDKQYHIRNVIVIFIVALFCRIFFLSQVEFEIAPFSDFAQVWQLANGDYTNLPYKSLFAAWMNFACFLRDLLNVFRITDYWKVLLIGEVVASFSSPILYVILGMVVPKAKKENGIPLLGGMISALYPPSSIFPVVCAPDILVVPLVLLSIACLLAVIKRCKYDMWSGVFSALAGVFCGLSSSLKPFGVVVLIAYAIYSFVLLLKQDRICKKKVFAWASCFAVLIIAYLLSKNLTLSRTEDVFEVSLDYSTATPHYLLIGLNSEGEGQIHVGSLARKYYTFVLEEGMSIESASEKTFALLKDDWEGNVDKLGQWLISKIIWAWQDDIRPAYYYRKYGLSGNESLAGIWLYKVVPDFSQMSYMVLMFFALLGGFFLLREDDFRGNSTFLNLICLGYFGITIISEAQSRYKYLIIPIVCCFAAFGMKSVELFFVKKCAKRMKKKND